jgi:hypothetical protein
MEEYLVFGMHHGVPIATTGPYACGVVQLFMLDMGISSTFHMARAWGLIGTRAAQEPRRVQPALDISRRNAVAAQLQERGSSMLTSRDIRASSSASPGAAARVKKVIEDAFRTAGLMR